MFLARMDRSMIKKTMFPMMMLGLLLGTAHQSMATPADVAVVVPQHCQTAQHEKRRVFHSMYADQQSAERAYAKITSYDRASQFLQLISAARRESIDSSTRDHGGDLGYITFGRFDKSFATSVFHQPLKTLSHPINSLFGWHLVWVSDALDIKTNQPCPYN
jgi:PPIC-type PPIASE domain